MKKKTSFKKCLIIVLALLISNVSAKADFTFGEPVNLGPTVNSPNFDDVPCISADGLSLYFASYYREGGYGDADIWVSIRETIDGEWGPPENLGPPVNSSAEEFQPSISTDGLELYFARYNVTSDASAIWVTKRATESDPWGEPVKLDLIAESEDEWDPSLSADGLELYFGFTVPGAEPRWDLCVTTRETKDSPWGVPMSLGPVVNDWVCQVDPRISSDGLLLLFADWFNAPSRPDGFGDTDIWFSRRATRGNEWEQPVNLGPLVNTAFSDEGGTISADGSLLYFTSDRPGGLGLTDIWQAPILPVVDFNNDGIVDSADMRIMVDHWGTDEPLCDISPMPWGDGIVDVQDLIVLAERFFTYPGALAYWKLDETEGDIAQDSANDNDGNVYGDPPWQHEGGMLDGALQLDGIDDYVSTPFVLNPAEGKFNVFVWIKGGAPGQAVLSQAGGANWLCVDALEGNLMTELKGPGRSTGPMFSQTNITDGNWHRIGFVWDGSHRQLYVDDVAVAEDTQDGLEGSEGGLYIGAGKAMEPGSFWSGLIDDVRIYNRAVKP